MGPRLSATPFDAETPRRGEIHKEKKRQVEILSIQSLFLNFSASRRFGVSASKWWLGLLALRTDYGLRDGSGPVFKLRI
jgi:hypothetical protein